MAIIEKENDKFLSLYPDDFVDDIWNQVCDVLNVLPSSKEIQVYFSDETITSLPQDDDDENTQEA